MNNIQLEFKLWFRRVRLRSSRLFSMFMNNYKEVINLISGLGSLIVGIIALLLVINDNTQQREIEQLRGIANDIKQQNYYTQDQTNELIGIAKSSENQNKLSNDLLKRVEAQTGLTNEQLLLSRKADSRTDLQLQVQQLANVFELRTELSDIANTFKSYDNPDSIWHNDYRGPSALNPAQRKRDLDLFNNVKSGLERGLTNKLLLSNIQLLHYWIKYYLYLQIQKNTYDYQYDLLVVYNNLSSNNMFIDEKRYEVNERRISKATRAIFSIRFQIQTEHNSFNSNIDRTLSMLENNINKAIQINPDSLYVWPSNKPGKFTDYDDNQ